LKQNLIDLQGKIDLLEKEINNLNITLKNDLEEENYHLNETIDKTKKE